MPNINSVLAKLKLALKCKNDVQLAKKLGGISPSTISTWKKRKTIPYDKIEEVSESKKIPFVWFVTDEDDGSISTAPVMAPILEKIPSSFPKGVDRSDFAGHFSIPDAPQGSYVIKAPDESMAPVVRQGDYLLFVPVQDFANGDFLVLQDEWGKLFARHCREKDGQYFLVAENPEFPALTLNDKFSILGRIVDAWRRINI